ncbi:MAG: hypothetical protein ACKVTZ_03385 [Bacteroidia bacterium]
MSKLNETIGNILEGIVEAHTFADRYAAKQLAVYASDAILKDFPVRRIEMQTVQLALRFSLLERNEEGETLIAVTNAELEGIPESRISTIEMQLTLRDHYAVPPVEAHSSA